MHLKSLATHKDLLITILYSIILLVVSQYYFISAIAWISYVPLIVYAIKKEMRPLPIFCLAFLLFFTQGIFLFGWMPTTAMRFMGSFSYSSYLMVIISSLVFALKSSIPIGIIITGMLRLKNKTLMRKYIMILGGASLYALSDWIFSLAFIELPWMFHFVGYTQATNIYFSQIAEIGGVWALTWFVMVINLMVALIWITKRKILIVHALLLIGVIHTYGAMRMKMMAINSERNVSAALICDNAPPEIRWDSAHINQYIHGLLELNKKANEKQPDLIVWNEGVVPWSYMPEDDFLKAILTQSRNALHLISYFTTTQHDTLLSYNSAYLIDQTGEVRGRYDKNLLLGFLEKPLWNINTLRLPFMGESPSSNMIAGENTQILNDPKIGKIGVAICNESLSDIVLSKQAANGADFLILMSNNSWFNKTRLINHHFYTTRIRAIENRKDIIINSNMGISGHIKSNGEIAQLEQPEKPNVVFVNITTTPSHFKYIHTKTIFIATLFLIFIFSLIIYNYE